MKEIAIRASSVPTFPDCALRWAVQQPQIKRDLMSAGYQLRALPRHIGAINGTAVHRAAAFSLEAKIRTGELGKDRDAEEIGIEAFKVQLAETDVLWDETTSNRDVAERQIGRQIRVYRRRIAPTLKPLAVELALEVTGGWLKPGFVLSGHPDEIEVIGPTDLKTGKVRRANAAQYGTYSFLCRAHKRTTADKLTEFYIPRNSKDEPEPVTIVYDGPTAERQAKDIVHHIMRSTTEFYGDPDNGVAALGPRAFLPNPASMLCNAKYCPAHGTTTCTAWISKETKN